MGLAFRYPGLPGRDGRCSGHIPHGRPVDCASPRLTSSNSFWVPSVLAASLTPIPGHVENDAAAWPHAPATTQASAPSQRRQGYADHTSSPSTAHERHRMDLRPLSRGQAP